MTTIFGQLSLGEAVRLAETLELLLPNFQRGFVWSAEQQASFAASVLLQVPSGSVLLVEGTRSEFSARPVGSRSDISALDPGLRCRFVLDGQQRITSARQVFADPFAEDWSDVVRDTFRTLKLRWSCRVVPSEDETEDLFGYRRLRFDGLPAEPNLLADRLVSHPIYLRNTPEQWFHPSSTQSDPPAARSLKVSSEASARGLVPLWGALDPQRKHIEQVIERLATTRHEELEAARIDHELDVDLLKELESEAIELGDTSQDRIQKALLRRRTNWARDITTLFRDTARYQFSTIQLLSTELDRAVVVFESINRGGEPLSAFDLVSARYTRAGRTLEPLSSSLVERIESRPESVPRRLGAASKWKPANGLMVKDGDLTSITKTHFLQTLTAKLSLEKYSAQRIADFSVSDIKPSQALKLSHEIIHKEWESAIDAVWSSWRFLQLRCAVPSESRLRNKLLLIPIACAFMSPQVRWTSDDYNKLEYWYWSSVLTNTYTANQNEQCVEDTRLLLQWLIYKKSFNPFEKRATRVFGDSQYSDKDTLLRRGEDVVGTDVGEYLLQFVTARGGKDLMEKGGMKLSVWQDELQDHHLIPLGSATSVGQSSREIRKSKSDELSKLLNSPLNRAYVLSSTNNKISDMPIVQYMQEVEPNVVASLYFADDAFSENASTASTVENFRDVLERRFDNLKSSAINHLESLNP